MENDKLLELAQSECKAADIEVVFEDKKMMLYKKQISSKPYFIDFSNHYYKSLILKKPGKKEPFAKALGVGHSTALDMTAGTLKDSFYMASLGFQVTALERSPTIYLLLQNAKEQLKNDDNNLKVYEFINSKIKLIHSDAFSYLEQLQEKPEVIYFDPMFPDKKKQALSQKSMQLFKALLPADELEHKKIVEKAKTKFQKRLICKRPLHAEALTPEVTQRYIGKSVRYDMISMV